MRLAAVLLLACPLVAADRTVRFTSPMYFLPPSKAVVLTKAGDPGPGHPKHEAAATAAMLTDEVKVAGDGPFDVWFVPKDGKPIKAVAGLKLKDAATEVKLNDHLGVIQFRGDGQPRGTLIATTHDDPGPEVKGHVAIQTAGDTRAEVAVLPGDYAIWVVPQSGARARRVAEKVRVFAGRTTTAD